ncbi:ABC transporter permease [Rhizobium sp. BK251]|uniref:ABC transporter permease n=1 Tax=Rhizobium sp. BK251 TaxID=2512125 RepID=UPI00104CDD31|nr:ABC transporter permease [Rhizobium sp. BK251]TCL68240.1 monosaccharide ABC transporter membrane protein (CUT2 family) [Rhizobium sp. BK251]
MTITNTSLKPVAPRASFLQIASRYGTLVAFLLLIVFNVAVTPNFLSWQTLNVNLTQVATIVIVATGMTLVIATGGIDLSVGSLMAISGAIAPMIFLGTLFPIDNMALAVGLAFVVPVIVAALFGWFNGLLVTHFSIQPIVATLVLFIAGRGIAQVMTNGNLQVFKNPSFQFIAMGHVAGIPAQVALMVVVAALAYCMIRFTVLGRQIIATGGNEKAAQLTGIPVRRVKTLVYVISGALAGIAGLVVVARNSASDANLVGMGMELDAIAAVAVGGSLLTGGRANIFGTLLGALVIQLVRYTLLANGVPDAAALVVKAGLIVVAVFIQQRADKS